MFCVKCGVKLSPELNKCPLCNTRIIDPDLVEIELALPKCEKKYSEKTAKAGINIAKAVYLRTAQFIIITAALLVMLVNLSVTSNLSWAKIALVFLAEAYSLMILTVRQYGKLTAGKIIFIQVIILCALFALFELMLGGNMKVSCIVVSSLLFAFAIGGSPFYSGKKIFIVHHIATCFGYVIAYLILLDLMTSASGLSLFISAMLIALFSYIMLPFLVTGKRKLEIIILLDLIVTVAFEFTLFYLLKERDAYLILGLPNSLYILLAIYIIFKVDSKKKLMIYGTLSMIFGFLTGFMIILNLTLSRVIVGYPVMLLSGIICSVVLLGLSIFFGRMELDIRLREWMEKKLAP